MAIWSLIRLIYIWLHFEKTSGGGYLIRISPHWAIPKNISYGVNKNGQFKIGLSATVNGVTYQSIRSIRVHPRAYEYVTHPTTWYRFLTGNL